jgi:Bacterial Ig-like domain (group 1)
MTARCAILVSGVCAAILVACEEQPVALSNAGSITLRIVTESATPGSATATSVPGHLDRAWLVVKGPVTDSLALVSDAAHTKFSGTLNGLRPGSYAVAVKGLVSGEVNYFGNTSDIQVRRGQNTAATIVFDRFQPILAHLGPPTAAAAFVVHWNPVRNASKYWVEWDTARSFLNQSGKSVSDTVYTIGAPATGTYWVRVRAVNDWVPSPAGQPSDSDSIQVAAPSASRSSVTAAPDTITASRGALTATITVTVRDGNGVPLRGATVTLDAAPDTGNTLTQPGVTDANGQVTGTLSSTKAELKTITARVNDSLVIAQSPVVAVRPSAATRLGFTAQPSDVPLGRNVFAAGYDIFPSVQLAALDAFGNTDSAYKNSIILSFGSNPTAATLSGAGPVAPASGDVAFPNLTIDKTGVGYTLAASSGTLAPDISAPFNVTIPGDFNLDGRVDCIDYALLVSDYGRTDRPPPDIDKNGTVDIFDYNILIANYTGGSRLAFTVQPSNSTAGSFITPPIQVTVQNLDGKTCSGSSDNITIAIGTNPSGGTLSGTTTATAVSGVATFANLSVDRSGSGYTLTAAAPGMNGATSRGFDVLAALRFSVGQPDPESKQ